ncbi:fimbrial protein [Rahnella sp. PCH160]|uniref:fimbrial protein n=1 Tax=Rahnella sp. PCH160 TaxID=3447928 RepID=UPI0039FC6C2F
MKIKFFSMVLLVFFNSFACASSFTANFTGSLSHGACTLSSASAEQTIDFGSIINKYLIANGVSPKQPLIIQLSGCDITSIKYAKVTFSGTADSEQSDYLAVTGSAKGIAIGIDTSDGVLLPINTTSPTMNLQDGTTNLLFYTYVKASSAAIANDGIGLGDFSSIATFVISYE